MMAADALREFLEPLLPGWRLQFGKWMDGTKTDRYAVIKPVGGLPAELIREPQFTLFLVGASNDAASAVADAADSIIEAMRTSSGALVWMQAGEPAFNNTDDGRPVFELAVSTITT